MSAEGIIFDIKQFAVFDGPGIRTTVFLKGCPLRCMWCHNPEGLSVKPQIMRSENGCLHCGNCWKIMESPETYVDQPDCIRVCPKHLIRICGTKITAEKLAEKLEKDRAFLKNAGGGVTFSGGEPFLQPAFLIECLERLSDLHRCIETSAFTEPEIFQKAVSLLDYVIVDLKLFDEQKHLYYTGQSNQRILQNINLLKHAGKPFRIRIPVIPGVNDDPENYEKTAAFLRDAENLDFVELLPYHTTAGAKYLMLGMEYKPQFEEGAAPAMREEIFREAGIACKQI